MIYFCSHSVGLSRNQDRNDFNEHGLIICDGIGQFDDSGKIADIAIKRFTELTSQNCPVQIRDIFKDIDKNIKESSLVGGTTAIIAQKASDEPKIRIGYLGNGGIIYLKGDYFSENLAEHPYMYTNLMSPHVNKDGLLLRHVSHNSGPNEILHNEITVDFNHENGDIIILTSDGITSLENQFVINDGADRYWRLESNLLQQVLIKLNDFLKENEFDDEDIIRDRFKNFLTILLEAFKMEGKLDDDASIGIVISDRVFTFYKNL